MQKKNLYCLLTVILFILIIVGLVFGKNEGVLMQSYFPNLLVSFGSIVLTVVIIENILERNNQKESERIAQVIKKQEYVDFLDIAGNEFSAFRSSIAKRYIIFVTQSCNMPGETLDNPKNYLQEVINNINQYIKDQDFFKKEYVLLEPIITFNPKYKKVSYNEFCYYYLKTPIFNETDKFLNRYISVIPANFRNTILKINNILKGNTFLSLNEYKIEINIISSQHDVENFRKEVKKLGETILKLFD